MSETNLTGKWTGQYSDGGLARPPVPFEASVIDTAGALGGSITERATSAPAPGTPLFAVISGTRDGKRVRFTKTYESNYPGYGRVQYSGRLNADDTEIEGRWRILFFSGKFLMVRAAGKAVEVARAIAVVG